MDKRSFTSVTSTNPKNIGTPKTVLEKYHKLKGKNKNLQKLVDAFDLQIEL